MKDANDKQITFFSLNACIVLINIKASISCVNASFLDYQVMSIISIINNFNVTLTLAIIKQHKIILPRKNATWILCFIQYQSYILLCNLTVKHTDIRLVLLRRDIKLLKISKYN